MAVTLNANRHVLKKIGDEILEKNYLLFDDLNIPMHIDLFIKKNIKWLS
jgi:hypothetical protein